MDTVEDLFKYLNDWGIHFALVLAGGVGAFVRMGKNDELNRWQKWLVIGTGGAVANYLTPVVFHFIKVSDDLRYGFAFLLGFWGQQGVKWILFRLKDKYSKDK